MGGITFGELRPVGAENLSSAQFLGELAKALPMRSAIPASAADITEALAKANGAGHVPFRNSKLTHLMQPCLSGQGKTLMVRHAAMRRNAAIRMRRNAAMRMRRNAHAPHCRNATNVHAPQCRNAHAYVCLL